MSQLDSMLQQMGDHLESHSKSFKEAVLLKKNQLLGRKSKSSYKCVRDWNQQNSKISIWLFKHLDFSVNKDVLTKPCRITDWDSGDWQDAAAVLTSRRDGCRVTAPSGVFVSRAESNSLRFNIDLTRRGMRRPTDESEPDRLPSLLLSCLHRWLEEGEKKKKKF